VIGNANTVHVDQATISETITGTMIGNGNAADIQQSGQYNGSIRLDQEGDFNTAFINQASYEGASHTVVSQTGTFNDAHVEQLRHYAGSNTTLTQTGTGNSARVIQ